MSTLRRTVLLVVTAIARRLLDHPGNGHPTAMYQATQSMLVGRGRPEDILTAMKSKW